MATSHLLNTVYLPIYNTPEGLAVYNDTLEVVTKSFPQYLRELQGTADGSKVDFHKVERRSLEKKSGQIIHGFLSAVSVPS